MTAPAAVPLGIYAVFGVRFLDYATGRVVGDQLHVTARPVTQLDLPVTGVVGPSGTVSFHHLPGLHDQEYPTPPLPLRVPVPRTFVVTVEDRIGWFLPALFLIDLPLVEPGSFPAVSVMPLIDAYVFSTASRPVPAGFAAVRADLRDVNSLEPVGHAVLKVNLAGVSGIGVADANGRVLVLLPTPTVERLRLGSPPGTGQASLGRQTWQADIRAFALLGLGPPTLVGGALAARWGTLPTLKTILDGQPEARFEVGPGTFSVSRTETLTYGEDLVLRTGSSSYLMISRGSSPP